jgi:hypothetical protein
MCDLSPPVQPECLPCSIESRGLQFTSQASRFGRAAFRRAPHCGIWTYGRVAAVDAGCSSRLYPVEPESTTRDPPAVLLAQLDDSSFFVFTHPIWTTMWSSRSVGPFGLSIRFEI